MAKRLTISVNFYKGDRKTAFSCVRFGNHHCCRPIILDCWRILERHKFKDVAKYMAISVGLPYDTHDKKNIFIYIH